MSSPEEIHRSFIAFDIEDPSILERIRTVQEELAATKADLKLVEPQNIHVTVRFLGEIPRRKVEQVCGEMKRIAFPLFNIRLRGVGAFPNARRPRVVWIGISEGSRELSDIFSQLEPCLNKLGFQREDRGFNPHLTIARVRSGRNAEQLAKRLLDLANHDFGGFEAKVLRLKRSVLTSSGPIYSNLYETACAEGVRK
jgi:2'-5' RNA ligase